MGAGASLKHSEVVRYALVVRGVVLSRHPTHDAVSRSAQYERERDENGGEVRNEGEDGERNLRERCVYVLNAPCSPWLSPPSRLPVA